MDLTSGNRKIFTCAEIESQETETTKPSSDVSILKLIDPAIMDFSTKSNVARYGKSEMLSLKETKSAQSPPACQYDPRIIRLNILKYKQQHPDDYEDQLKTFRNLLPNLSLSSWDPNLLELLNTYQKSLLRSQPDLNNSYNSDLNDASHLNRRISWSDQRKIFEAQHVAYDRKNFFDTITTTTTMRPPRMGVGSLKHQKAPQEQHMQPFFKNAKNNSFSNDRYGKYLRNSSTGSGMSETISSQDSLEKSTDRGRHDVSGRTKDSDNCSDGTEPEPEWFSFPASRSDVIDLHGFEDEQLESRMSSLMNDSGERQRKGPMVFDNFSNYGQHRENNMNNPSRFPNYNQQNRIGRASMNYNPPNTQHRRYRNPPQAKNPLMNQQMLNESDNINPFFENWKRRDSGQFQANQENANHLNWMNPGANSGMLTMANVESFLKLNTNQQYPIPSTAGRSMGYQSVPQFLQNASLGLRGGNLQNAFFPNAGNQQQSTMSNPFGFGIPTQEQLQEHTSQIMRNAIIRKHNNDGSKMPK